MLAAHRSLSFTNTQPIQHIKSCTFYLYSHKLTSGRFAIRTPFYTPDLDKEKKYKNILNMQVS